MGRQMWTLWRHTITLKQLRMETFNCFNNLKMNENQHSNLLKKLLHPNGRHNQGVLFLKSFVEDVLKSDYYDDLLVEREVKAGIKGYVDLKISSKECTFVIENKILNAEDRPSQLYRYWRNHIYGKNGKLFYLTKDGSKPNNFSLVKPCVSKRTLKYDGFPEILPIDVKSISYKTDISCWMRSCLSAIEKKHENIRIICTLEQYVEWIDKFL